MGTIIDDSLGSICCGNKGLWLGHDLSVKRRYSDPVGEGPLVEERRVDQSCINSQY